MLVYHYP